MHNRIKNEKKIQFSFPTSIMFGKKNIEFVEERRLKLEQYLKSVAGNSNTRGIALECLGGGQVVDADALEKPSQLLFLTLHDIQDISPELSIHDDKGETYHALSLFDNIISSLEDLQSMELSLFGSTLNFEKRLEILDQTQDRRTNIFKQFVDLLAVLSSIRDSNPTVLNVINNLKKDITQAFDWNSTLEERVIQECQNSYNTSDDVRISNYHQSVEQLWTTISMDHTPKVRERCYKALQLIKERIQKDLKRFTSQDNAKMVSQLTKILEEIKPVLDQKAKHSKSIHENELLAFEAEVNDILEMAQVEHELTGKECFQYVTKQLEKLDNLRGRLSKRFIKIKSSVEEDDLVASNKIDEWQRTLADLEYRLMTDYQEVLENHSTTMKLSVFAKEQLVQQINEEHEDMEEDIFNL